MTEQHVDDVVVTTVAHILDAWVDTTGGAPDSTWAVAEAVVRTVYALPPVTAPPREQLGDFERELLGGVISTCQHGRPAPCALCVSDRHWPASWPAGTIPTPGAPHRGGGINVEVFDETSYFPVPTKKRGKKS